MKTVSMGCREPVLFLRMDLRNPLRRIPIVTISYSISSFIITSLAVSNTKIIRQLYFTPSIALLKQQYWRIFTNFFIVKQNTNLSGQFILLKFFFFFSQFPLFEILLSSPYEGTQISSITSYSSGICTDYHTFFILCFTCF